MTKKARREQRRQYLFVIHELVSRETKRNMPGRSWEFYGVY